MLWFMQQYARWKWWLLPVLIIATAVVFWKIDFLDLFLGRVRLWDFDVYYQTAVDVFAGANPYQLPYMQTGGPPAVIIPYLPFTLVPLPVARSLLNSLNVMAVAVSCWLLVQTIFQQRRLKHHPTLISRLNLTLLLNLLCWLTFLPRYNLIMGQPNLIIMWLVTVLLTVPSVKNRVNHRAASLATIILLKTHYLFSVLSFIRFNQRTLFIAGAIFAGIVLLSLPVITPRHYQTYFQERLGIHILTAPPIRDLDYYNQSLRSTLSRLGINQFYPVIAVILLLAGAVYLIKTGDTASGILLSLLLSPIVWQHYLVVVYPIALITIWQYWQRRQISWFTIIGLALLILHLPWLHGQPVSLIPGILASHFYLAVMMIWLGRVKGRYLHILVY